MPNLTENHGHVWYKCPPQADGKSAHYDAECHYCPICDGGLASCTRCHGAEGSLPSECPGEKISPEDQQLIYQGTLDFRDGKWQRRPYEDWETPDEFKEIVCSNAVRRLNHKQKRLTRQEITEEASRIVEGDLPFEDCLFFSTVGQARKYLAENLCWQDCDRGGQLCPEDLDECEHWSEGDCNGCSAAQTKRALQELAERAHPAGRALVLEVLEALQTADEEEA